MLYCAHFLLSLFIFYLGSVFKFVILMDLLGLSVVVSIDILISAIFLETFAGL